MMGNVWDGILVYFGRMDRKLMKACPFVIFTGLCLVFVSEKEEKGAIQMG